MGLKVVKRQVGEYKGLWFVKYCNLNSKMWRDISGPCKTEHIAKVQLNKYEKQVNCEFNAKVKAQVMAKLWGKVKL